MALHPVRDASSFRDRLLTALQAHGVSVAVTQSTSTPGVKRMATAERARVVTGRTLVIVTEQWVLDNHLGSENPDRPRLVFVLAEPLSDSARERFDEIVTLSKALWVDLSAYAGSSELPSAPVARLATLLKPNALVAKHPGILHFSFPGDSKTLPFRERLVEELDESLNATFSTGLLESQTEVVSVVVWDDMSDKRFQHVSNSGSLEFSDGTVLEPSKLPNPTGILLIMEGIPLPDVRHIPKELTPLLDMPAIPFYTEYWEVSVARLSEFLARITFNVRNNNEVDLEPIQRTPVRYHTEPVVVVRDAISEWEKQSFDKAEFLLGHLDEREDWDVVLDPTMGFDTPNYRQLLAHYRQLLQERKPPDSETLARLRSMFGRPEQEGWQLYLMTHAETATVGQMLIFMVTFHNSHPGEAGAILITLDNQPLELTTFIEAPDFYIRGGQSRIVTIDRSGKFSSDTIVFEIMPRSSGESELTLTLHGGTNVRIIPYEIQIANAPGGIDPMPFCAELRQPNLIPHPKPDIQLFVLLEPGSTQVVLYLTSPLLDMKQHRLGTLPLTLADVAVLNATAVEIGLACSGRDVNLSQTQQLAFGRYLYSLLVPQALEEILLQLAPLTRRQRITWLVVSDLHLRLPWEMVIYYYDPSEPISRAWPLLSETFSIHHWIAGQEFRLYNEIPLGLVALADSTRNADEMPADVAHWNEVVGVDIFAPGSLRMVADPSQNAYALHQVEREGERWEIKKKESQEKQSSSDEVRENKLYLSLARPLIAMSYLLGKRFQARETPWLHDLVQKYLRAGAATVIVNRWPVSERAARAFYTAFYRNLYAGTTIYLALDAGRDATRRAIPNTAEWLAFVHYGLPDCAPYLVQASKGHAVFECLEQSLQEPFATDRSYRFRASYRLTAPPWYAGRVRTITQPASSDLQYEVWVLTDIEPVKRIPLTYHDGAYYSELTVKTPADSIPLSLTIQFRQAEQKLNTLLLQIEVES